jgi:hypothetical protein
MLRSLICILSLGNAAAMAAQKKATDSSLNPVNTSHVATAVSETCRPTAAARQSGTGSQARSKLLPPAPCPNCCVDGAKSAPRPTPSGSSNSAQSSIDVDAQTDSNHDTALTLAAAGGHARLVSLLLSRGANVEHRDKKGALFYLTSEVEEIKVIILALALVCVTCQFLGH